MYDLEIALIDNRTGLAELGEVMGRAGIAFEGGGVFTIEGHTRAHFLFRDGPAAQRAVETAGIAVAAVTCPVIRRLKQGKPGQLGAIARALADAGVRIHVQYSDHHGRLILICDDPEKAAQATMGWATGEAP